MVVIDGWPTEVSERWNNEWNMGYSKTGTYPQIAIFALKSGAVPQPNLYPNYGFQQLTCYQYSHFCWLSLPLVFVVPVNFACLKIYQLSEYKHVYTHMYP
jgi:hypothetical protein